MRRINLSNVPTAKAGVWEFNLFYMRQLIFILLLVGHCIVGQQATIIRGPYLQSVTTTSAIVHWRTEKPISSRLYYQDSRKVTREVSDTNRVTEHIVQLTQLKPGTRYSYQIDSKQFLNDRYLVTVPGSEKSVRIWALGDFGDGSVSQKAVMESIDKYTKDHRPDAWIWLGDNAYNNGKDEEYQKMYLMFISKHFYRICPFILRRVITIMLGSTIRLCLLTSKFSICRWPVKRVEFLPMQNLTIP